MIEINQTFSGDYDVEVLGELPALARPRRFYFPGASSVGGQDGLLVQVTPAKGQESWIGVFAFGSLSTKGLSGIFTCPNPSHLCVVARGEGYIVAADTPIEYELVKTEPIFGVHPVASLGLLIFFDYLRLTAYSSKGLAWQTKRLSWDGLQVEGIEGEQLFGKAWSSPENRTVDFKVDLRTGDHEGGASPSAD